MVHGSQDIPFFVGARSTAHLLSKWWGLLLLRGLYSVLFGFLVLVWPEVTLLTLILFYGTYLLVDGVFVVIAMLASRTKGPWWLTAAGLLSIAAGVLTFSWLNMTALILLYVIALWAAASGLLHIIGVIALRKELDDKWFLIAGGIFSVFFVLLFAVRPGVGAVALFGPIGTYAILQGILLASVALRLRKHDNPSSDVIH